MTTGSTQPVHPAELHAMLQTRADALADRSAKRRGARANRANAHGRRRSLPVALVATAIATALFAAVSFALVNDSGTCDVQVASKATSSGLCDLTVGKVEYIGSSANNQSSGTGIFNPFVRLQGSPTENGYNTDGAVAFDTKAGNWTHAILADDIPVVTIDGVDYWELFVDINEGNNSKQITLTDVEVWFTTNPNLTGYNENTGAFPGATKEYDFEGSILINDVNQGSGRGDLRYLIPITNITPWTSSTYFVLYSEWGATSGNFASDGGFEEWKVRIVPSITVDKTASPLSLPEPGGNFTFTVVVTNNGESAVTITSLDDDIYGPLAGDADCQIGTVLAANGGSCTFSFVGAFAGNAGDSQTDTVTACAEDADDVSDCDDDPATVTITDVAPTITVDKTASPLSLPEPGGNFTFTVVVTNNAAEAVTITSLDDDIYGPLAGDADCQIGTVLAASGGNCTFDFVGAFAGNAGDSQTDTVEACADDDDGTEACDDDPATVTITDVAPTITVDKTASPLSLPEPGGNFTFTVVVTNNAAEAVTITSLDDDIYGPLAGDADCQIGTVLAASGGNCTFDFVGAFAGNAGDSQTDTVEACADDDDGTEACDDDPATVTITDVAPTITVDKTASPLSLPEPGGNFTFTVVVTNNAAEAVTITSLDDDIYGPLAGDADCQIGTVLAASGGNCTFDFVGAFAGNAGDSQTDTVEACADDDDGTEACDDDPATVTITDVAPTITVDKTASPLSLPEPGGNFTFTVVVTNNAAEAVTITSLDDDIYGPLAGDADCQIGTVLAASGGNCTFDFVGAFAGNAGDSQTDTVEACADDDDGTEACDDDPATVTITEAPGGNLFHTGTTCQQFIGTAPPVGLAGQEIEFVNYSVKNGVISQTDPGVFFYYSTVEGNGGSLVVTIDQTAPATFNHPFAVQNTNNVRVFDANCNTYSSFSVSSIAGGDVTLTINGTTSGAEYIISVKYETSSVKGFAPPVADPSDAYTFETKVGAVVVDSDANGIRLDLK